MVVQAYPAATSVPQGGDLDIHLNDDSGGTTATIVVSDAVSGAEMARVNGVQVGTHPTPADPGTSAGILVSIPFPTFHAYSYAGTPGASPYWNEQPDRGGRVTLHRPCPVGPGWETPAVQWLASSGFDVDYCSGFDLHDGAGLLGAYQLLVCIGHDEYWSAPMRDTAEQFLADGGNVAFLTGNTCWWQFRLEDDDATLVCYRDATADPSTGSDNVDVTVEWTSPGSTAPRTRSRGRASAGVLDRAAAPH